MAENIPRCLIGTLYVGENELEACEKALRKQNYTKWEHFRLDHLPEQEAHEKLYRAFMDNRASFDLFVKLDADMVLRHPQVLGGMVDFIQRRPSLDHACFTVQDYMTNHAMLGLHLFTNRARWEEKIPQYFPDQKPKVPGECLMVTTSPAPAAYHAADPTPYQAFHFGAHRMLKALVSVSPYAEAVQLNILNWVAQHTRQNQDRRLRLALLGALHVWNGDIKSNAKEANDQDKYNLFARYANMDAGTLDQKIPSEWFYILKRYHRLNRIYYSSKQKASLIKQRFKGLRLVDNSGPD